MKQMLIVRTAQLAAFLAAVENDPGFNAVTLPEGEDITDTGV